VQTILLYFVTFGWVFVLFTSAIVLAGWTLIKTLDTLAAAYLAITRPDIIKSAGSKTTLDRNLHHLKRAGQW
jgi:hypothetical protein